jgi:hypothetical protein
MRPFSKTLRAPLAIAAVAVIVLMPADVPASTRLQEQVRAQGGPRQAPTHLTFKPGHSVKKQQLIGGSWNIFTCSPLPLGMIYVDQDWETGKHLLNKTYTDYQVAGCDEGSSFEVGPPGERVCVFLWGDTMYFGAEDAVAATTSTDPEAGVALQFLREGDGSTFVVGNHVPFPMTTDDVPEGGISIAGDTYIACSTGYDNTSNTHPPYLNKHTVLTHVLRDLRPGTWDVGRTVSSNANGGHFVELSLVQHGDEIYMFGTGGAQDSNIYLARIPAKQNVPYPKNNFWTAKQPTQYFAGYKRAIGTRRILGPNWIGTETDARVTPVVVDNPIVNGQPLNLGPTAKKVSVQFEPRLGLWLMTFEGGRQQRDIGDPNRVEGIYFSYATQPWGPWEQPQLIYNAARDGGFGTYINNPDLTIAPDNPYATTAPTGGPQGPTIGQNDPCTEPGHVYAPFMIQRFNKIDKNYTTFSLYYVMSTWNPYTPLLMRSDFSIIH